MAHNVKVVYDVFWVAIKKLRSSFSNPKNVAERKPHKGRSPTAVFRSPSRFSGEAYTILLCAVRPFSDFYQYKYSFYFSPNLFLHNILFQFSETIIFN
jgi:hypothetical protein